MEKGRQKHRAMAKEIDGLEHRLTKSKAGLARLRNRAEELRARIEQYRRLVAARRSDGAGALWGDYPPDTPDPARVSGFAVDEHQQRSPPSAEGQILASLERRLAEVEGEMRASAREIEAQGRLLLDALGRQDRMRARMAQALERSDTLRRSGLQAASTAFVEAEARATQRSLFQLESLMQLAARVDAERDQQAFIARHRDGVGTAPRAPALRVLLDHQEWRGRLQRRHGGEEEEGHWHEVGMGAAPSSPPASFDGMLIPRPLSVRAVECDDDEEEENGEEVASPTTKGSPPSRDVDSPTSSPDRTGVHGGRKERREEVVVPSFDEKEDGAVVASFVQQLFAADRATEEASGAAAAPSPEAAAATDKKGRLELREGYFDWDRFPTSTESPSSTAAAAVGGFSFHSTATERARFFDRVLATEDGRGRAAFLAELNLQRSKKTNIGAGFEELAQLLWTFLLHAQRHRDVHGAKLGMMLASTFYRLRPGLPGTAAAPADKETKREFLSRRLQDHPLWRDAAFWTRALQEQVREQLEEMGELLPFGAKAWHDAGHEARAEVVARIHNTCFSNAAALAHSMLEVGAPIEDARTFAVRVSEQYGLPEEAEHMLLQHLARREQRHSHHHRPSKHEQRQPQPQPQQQPTMLPGQEGGHVTESSIG